jgi:hypothetical protein
MTALLGATAAARRSASRALAEFPAAVYNVASACRLPGPGSMATAASNSSMASAFFPVAASALARSAR